jgi:hypothetical protein
MCHEKIPKTEIFRDLGSILQNRKGIDNDVTHHIKTGGWNFCRTDTTPTTVNPDMD